MKDAETERDGARAMVERLDTSENAQRNQRHVAERERDALRARLDALSCWVPSDDTLNLMREAIPGDKSIMRAHWRAAAIVVRDALLTAKEPGEEGRAGVTIPPAPAAAAADQRAPAPASTLEIPDDGRVFVIFDGPPSHESGRFIEVEDAHGSGVGHGCGWIHRLDGLWSLGPFYLSPPAPSVAPAPTPDDLPVAPSCTRCMDLRVVQTSGGAAPCPACVPAPPRNRCATCRVVVGPSPGWHECRGATWAASILRRAEDELASIANNTGRLIYPDEADALIAELARLRAEKEPK